MTKKGLLDNYNVKVLEFSEKCDKDFPKLMEGCIENSTPVGWQEDVYEALEKLNNFVSEGIYIGQIKSKFGGLRLYVGINEFATDTEGADIHRYCCIDIPDLTANKVDKKCEFTGKPANKFAINNWIYTVCDEVKEILENG